MTAPFAIEVITLVPDLWPVILGQGSGLVGKACNGVIASLQCTDLRTYGTGVHQQVDDAPYGGGAGMLLKPEPLHRAITDARGRTLGPVILLSPRGKKFTQQCAHDLAKEKGMTLICGRYEGVDERVRDYVDLELSVGNYVLSAGDPAAWSICDAVVRLLPGVLGNPQSLDQESFEDGMLEYPQYTRPSMYEGVAVPDVLLSGDHQAIARWRKKQAKNIA